MGLLHAKQIVTLFPKSDWITGTILSFARESAEGQYITAGCSAIELSVNKESTLLK
jgi:hypothetical protein